MVATVLSDEPFLNRFLNSLSAQLQRQYQEIVQSLATAGIPCLPAAAGVFVMVDLRRYLHMTQLSSWEAELALWRHLLEHAKVGLTPGCRMHVSEPGWFRWCFAYHTDPTFNRVAVVRVLRALKQLEHTEISRSS
jgi:DNA-binding transcriptional MocR family regulator